MLFVCLFLGEGVKNSFKNTTVNVQIRTANRNLGPIGLKWGSAVDKLSDCHRKNYICYILSEIQCCWSDRAYAQADLISTCLHTNLFMAIYEFSSS